MKKSARIFAWHHWLGLVTGALLLVVSVSGALLVFHKEIDIVTYPAAARLKAPVEQLQFDSAITAVQQRYPLHRLRLYLNQAPKQEALLFEARGTEGHRLVYVHPQTGEILHDIDRFSAPSRWLLKLHYTFFAGLAGNIFLGLLGICMLLSLVTGILIYRKRILPVLLFREKLSLQTSRAFYSGTHRYVGVWSLLFNLLLAITGIWIQVQVILANTSGGKSAAPMPTPKVSLQMAWEEIEKRRSDFEPAFIIMPADSLSPIVVYGKSKYTHRLLPAYSDQLLIDTRGDKGASLTLFASQPLTKQIHGWMISLHFGSFGGLPIKIFYFIFGLSPAWLSISGWLLWRKRKKKANSPQPAKRPKRAFAYSG